MMTLEIEQAELLKLIQQGEEIVLLRRNEPIAKVTPLPAVKGKRQLGTATGQFSLADDFDAPLDDFCDYQ